MIKIAIPLQWEEDERSGSVTLIAADGGVILSDHSREVMPEWLDEIIKAVNSFDALIEACEAWDKGFVDGEDFDADQFLAWVNANRRLARAALAKARGE